MKTKILLIICVFALVTTSQGQTQHYTHKYGMMRTKVLNHFSASGQDSLKLKAAHFILDNMYLRKTVTCPELEKLILRLDSIQRMENYSTAYRNIIASINRFYDGYSNPHVAYEYANVTAEDIISDINDAFSHWGEKSYGRNLSFDEFCEYILAPTTGNSLYTPWRRAFRKRYDGIFERLKLSDDRRWSAFQAAAKLNYTIRHTGVMVKMIELPFGIDYPADKIIDIHTGSCRDFAVLASYAMRAFGIPVSVDFTPQWPNRAGGHYWNCVHSDNGYSIPFSGAQSDPGLPFYPESPMAKVYRMTYAYQKNSLASLMKDDRDNIPQNLANPFMKDVTSEYVKTTDLTINVGMQQSLGKIMYISVFNNQDWVPVDYAVVDSGVAKFRNLGKGIVYLPSFWDKSQGLLGGMSPVEITASGKIRSIEPDMSKRQTITLTRKYPVMASILGYSERMKGGYIEASNEADFPETSTVRMGEVERCHTMNWDSIKVNRERRSYRYWRYKSPVSGWCNIAEAQFLSQGRKVASDVIMSDTTRTDSRGAKSAFDGKPLTYYESNTANGGWIGLDFGKPVSIDTFRFLPRNDDNNVVPGHEYELFVYVHGVSTSLGKVRSHGNSVTFRNVPVGGLYVLHDCTRGREERIFTYKNGEVTWH